MNRFATFSAAQAACSRYCDASNPERRQHHGLHAERGKEPMRLIRLYAGHDLNHLKQIDALTAPEPRSTVGSGLGKAYREVEGAGSL